MLTPDQLETLRVFAEAAVTSEVQTGVPAEITLAQGILESSWGKQTPPGSCNLFGIKDTDAFEGASYAFTKEWIDGKEQTLKLAFEVFPNEAACFNYHGALISGGLNPAKPNCYLPHYRLYKQDHDLRGYLWGISAHYATAPTYAASIMAFWKMPDFIAALAAAKAVKGTTPV